MKRIASTVVALGLASSAMATVSFDFGSSWWFPRFDNNGSESEYYAAQGQTFGANWDLDNDLILGVYTENGNLSDGEGWTVPYYLQAVNVSKGVMKNASVGLRLGTFYEADTDSTGMLTDLTGTVTLVSGAADKLSGTLKATFGGRFANNQWNGGNDFSGYFVGATVGLGF